MNIGNQLYATAVILIIYWTIGLFVFNAGILIHALLLIAIIAVMVRIIQTITGINISNIYHSDLSAML
jgi:hypothetical protein